MRIKGRQQIGWGRWWESQKPTWVVMGASEVFQAETPACSSPPTLVLFTWASGVSSVFPILYPHHLILIFLCVAILSLCWIEAVSLRQGIQPIHYVDSIKYETFLNTKPPFLHHCSSPVELFMHFIIGTFPTQFLPCSLFQHRFLIQLLILCSSSDFSCPYTKPDIACCKGSWRNEWL